MFGSWLLVVTVSSFHVDAGDRGWHDGCSVRGSARYSLAGDLLDEGVQATGHGADHGVAARGIRGNGGVAVDNEELVSIAEGVAAGAGHRDGASGVDVVG